jgi:bifunctional non-homologous end joining protein LigD
MKRYPDGVEGEFFYEKNCPSHRPKWVKTAKVWSEGNNRLMNYCLAQDLPTLVWAANLADLELHTSLSRKNNIKRPTMMVFDLDPGAPADIVQCCQVGLWLRDLLAGMKLKSFAKTSGSKGLQVYVPLNTAVTYDRTKDLSRALAQHLILSPRTCRSGTKEKCLLIGVRTTNTKPPSVSIRSAPGKPTVSTPVTWDEVENCLKKKKADLLRFRSDKALIRVDKLGDVFEPVEKLKQKLPKKWNCMKELRWQ